VSAGEDKKQSPGLMAYIMNSTDPEKFYEKNDYWKNKAVPEDRNTSIAVKVYTEQ
jgi:hypothetical protein